MLISPDAGLRFYHSLLPTTDSIIDVALLNPAIGFAVTVSNQLLQSEDSGRTWKVLPLTFNNPVRLCVVREIVFLIEETGRCFRRSSDGEWMLQGTAPASKVTALSFTNQQVGVIIDRDAILFRTTDAGITWNQIIMGSGSPVQGVSLYEDIGVLFCKNDGIFVSSNQGATWDSVAVKEYSTVNTKGVLAIDNNRYLVYGGFGASRLLGYSSDAGHSWQYSVPILSNDKMQLLDAATTNSGTVILVGKFSTILRSDDGGKNWQVRANAVLNINNDQSPYIADISFASDSIAVAVISGGTDNFSWLQTTDAGTTWIYKRQTLGGGSAHIHAVHFFDQEHGVMVTSNPNSNVRTLDTGNSWYFSNISLVPTITTIKQVHYINRSNSWMIADNSLFFSSDSGASWNGNPLPSGWTPQRIHVASSTNTLITARSGNDERLYRTSDKGITWWLILERSGLPQPHQLGDVYFFDRQNGILSLLDTVSLEPSISIRNRTIRTTNGGVTWDTVSNQFFNDIEMLTPSQGYGVGTAGVWFTNDAGKTWINEPLLSSFPFTVNLKKIIASPQKSTVLVIGNGAILRKEVNVHTTDAPILAPPFPLGLDLSMNDQ